MSIRANSLRNVVVDTLLYTGVVSLAAVGWTAMASGAEPRIVHVADAVTEDRPSSDHVDSRLNTDDNRPSGIPEESPAAKREAMMLGMKLLERAEGEIEVLDVAAKSPAWDAGIRRGDRINEIDGVAPKALADWVKDVAKVLDNHTDGKVVSAEVERDGYPLAVSIKVPVSNAAQARDARKQDEAIAKEQVRQQRQNRQGQPAGAPVVAGGVDRNDYRYAAPGYGGYGGWGFGGFFDDRDAAATSGVNGEDRMATSAAAPLMAVNTLGRNGTQTTGGQVGMAGFQNNGDGVDAMVVVRGLPQGTYQVGIGAGGQVGVDGTSDLVGPDVNAPGFGLQPELEGTADSFDRGGANNIGPDNNQGNPNQVNPQNPAGNQFPNQQQPGFAPGSQTPVAPQGNVPAPGAGGTPDAGGAAPAAGDGASLANPQNAILAQQQVDTPAGPTSGQQGVFPAQPSTRQGQQNNTGATQPNNRPAGPGANPYDPRDRAEAQRRGQGTNPLGGVGGSPFVASIGTLQIGADGSGQVQNRLEGMSVRNLAGMQVIVQSTNWGGQAVATDPRFAPNGAVQNNAAQGQSQAAQNQAAQGQARPGQGNLNDPAAAATGQTPTRGAQGIVAAGTIQLRGGHGGANQQTGTGQNAVDEATQREQGRSQISDPSQQFNPSNPLQ